MFRLSSILAAGGIIAVSVALAALLISLAPEPTRTEQPPQVPFVQTSVVATGIGPIPVFGSGTVRPSAEIDVIPQVGGRIVWVDPGFRSGGRIAADQTVFRIEEIDYQNRVRVAEANLAASRVVLLKEEEQASIARAQYELYAAREGKESSSSDANPLALREPQLKAARAALDRDEARLADANLDLSRTRITVPFDGYVQEESVDTGQIVSAGQPVARVYSTDTLEIVVPLTDSDAALIPGLWALRAGDGNRRLAARVVARYGDGTYAWRGYVDRGESSLDRLSRTIDVIVIVPNPVRPGSPMEGTVSPGGAPPLLVGKFVEVQIDGLELDGYYQVARAALQSGNEVWTVNEAGTVSIVPVQVLQRAGDEVFVTGALEDGQAVITGGIPFATEGMRVQMEADPNP